MASGNDSTKASTTCVQGPKCRHMFTYDRDVCLLQLIVQLNPWQHGKDYWNQVHKGYNEAQQCSVTMRTLKDRLDLLLGKYIKEVESQTKTGVEEEETEKGALLKEIAGYIEESNTPCNTEIGPDYALDSSSLTTPMLRCNAVAAEKKQADTDRDQALQTFSSGAAPQANTSRRKRMKIAPEDELIKAKMELDLRQSTDRLRMEEQRQQHDLLMEDKLFILKQERLKATIEKEAQKAESRRRKDDIAVQQLNVQQQMLAMFGTILKKDKSPVKLQ